MKAESSAATYLWAEKLRVLFTHSGLPSRNALNHAASPAHSPIKLWAEKSPRFFKPLLFMSANQEVFFTEPGRIGKQAPVRLCRHGRVFCSGNPPGSRPNERPILADFLDSAAPALQEIAKTAVFPTIYVSSTSLLIRGLMVRVHQGALTKNPCHNCTCDKGSEIRHPLANPPVRFRSREDLFHAARRAIPGGGTATGSSSRLRSPIP